MKILLGYDGSEGAENAMKLALTHAKAFSATIQTLASLEVGFDDHAQAEKKAGDLLKHVKDFFEENQIQCETHTMDTGKTPGEDLVQFAQENDIDQIIIGIKKKSKVGKLLGGSNAHTVIIEADCPVLTVK
jgi:nucleotide-binding universal stress UspA family protein